MRNTLVAGIDHPPVIDDEPAADCLPFRLILLVRRMGLGAMRTGQAGKTEHGAQKHAAAERRAVLRHAPDHCPLINQSARYW
jgi:hypothetical protein